MIPSRRVFLPAGDLVVHGYSEATSRHHLPAQAGPGVITSQGLSLPKLEAKMRVLTLGH